MEKQQNLGPKKLDDLLDDLVADVFGIIAPAHCPSGLFHDCPCLAWLLAHLLTANLINFVFFYLLLIIPISD